MRLRHLPMFTALLAVTLLTATHAEARSRRGGYSVEVVDASGRTLPAYGHRGENWILGQYNQRYSLRVRNHTGNRIEAVVTVDGRDVLSGQPGDYASQRGYVVDAWGSVTIEGFRRNHSTVAAFRFTTPGDSYAGRMGTTRNVGVLGVAVFAERRRRIHRRPVAKRKRGWGRAQPAPASPMDMEASADDNLAGASRSSSRPRRESKSNIGTRYGENRHSAVTEVRFVRQNASRPTQILTLRYDDHAGLVRRGIVPPIRYAAPNPFPRHDFAPPPP